MKFLAFFFLTSSLTALVSSLSVKAAERGARKVASFGQLSVVEHPQDDGNLTLLIATEEGAIRNDNLVAALERDEGDPSSYQVSAKPIAGGATLISSVKDWGTSTWSYGYTVAKRGASYRLTRFDYKVASKHRAGTCSLDLASGRAVVNGREQSFEAPGSAIETVDGIDLERLCERLGLND